MRTPGTTGARLPNRRRAVQLGSGHGAISKATWSRGEVHDRPSLLNATGLLKSDHQPSLVLMLRKTGHYHDVATHT